MREAKTIYQQTRATSWPAPKGTHVTVSVKIDNADAVGITWERDDLVEKGNLPSRINLTASEFQAIAAAFIREREWRKLEPSS